MPGRQSSCRSERAECPRDCGKRIDTGTDDSILENMKLVANIQLKPTKDQSDLLRRTLERCNDACNWLSQRGFDAGKVRQYDLHKLAYAECRSLFDIAAQVTVRCIAKVADAYVTNKANGREPKVMTFRKYAAQPYDDRIIRLMPDSVSLWTIDGRAVIPFVCGERQRKLLAFRKGEIDLMLVRGKWYLAVVCDVPDPAAIDVEGVIGIDFGIVNLAFDSEGKAYTGAEVERVRQKFNTRRKGLQSKGTKAAKRKLKRLSGQEGRFRKHVNHCISKEIVATAERHRFAIAVEELTKIRTRVRARKSQRNRLHGWAFRQLRSFVEYKAKLAGVPVVAIDPRNTSRTCPCCGVIDKANRRTQANFSCVSCGHQAAADYVAARNIRAAGAAVTRPYVLARNS